MSETANAPADKARGTRLAEIVFPDLANHYGTLFGGNALSLMGKAAFLAAARRARRDVVMAASNNIKFHAPVRVGELVEFVADVARVGRTSLTVTVEMVVEALPSGERRTVGRGSFEMVAVGANGRPVPIGDPVPSIVAQEALS